MAVSRSGLAVNWRVFVVFVSLWAVALLTSLAYQIPLSPRYDEIAFGLYLALVAYPISELLIVYSHSPLSRVNLSVRFGLVVLTLAFVYYAVSVAVVLVFSRLRRLVSVS